MMRPSNADPQSFPGPSTAPRHDLPQFPGPSGAASASAPPAAANDVKEFPLRFYNDDDLKDSRYHMLKFHSRNPVDPAAQFTPPIRFNRKDPSLVQVTAEEAAGEGQEGNAEDVKPDEAGAGAGPGAEGEKKKNNPFSRRKKTHQVQGGDDDAKKLRSEEHLPWVMEDFDNKNTWISSYEAAQSDSYAVFVYDHDGFKVIPLEKWYKMSQVGRYATLSLEDAEDKMERTHNHRDRWFMSTLQPRQVQQDRELQSQQLMPDLSRPRMRTVIGSEERKPTLDEELDYDDAELFDDDEGAPIMDGPEEDVKDIEGRMRREQRQANQLLEADDRYADIDELFGDNEEHMDKQGKKLRRYLRSLEKNQFYDSDEDENPYASEPSSESEDELSEAQASNLIKQEPTDPVVMLPQQFQRKVFKGLPQGYAILQLPPEMLSKFPTGEWNKNIPSRYKRTETEPAPAAATASSSSSAAAVPQDTKPADSGLLTREDVTNCIVSGQTTIRELVGMLRDKLKQNPSVNKDLLTSIMKEVARTRDGKLYLIQG